MISYDKPHNNGRLIPMEVDADHLSLKMGKNGSEWHNISIVRVDTSETVAPLQKVRRAPVGDFIEISLFILRYRPGAIFAAGNYRLSCSPVHGEFVDDTKRRSATFCLSEEQARNANLRRFESALELVEKLGDRVRDTDKAITAQSERLDKIALAARSAEDCEARIARQLAFLQESVSKAGSLMSSIRSHSESIEAMIAAYRAKLGEASDRLSDKEHDAERTIAEIQERASRELDELRQSFHDSTRACLIELREAMSGPLKDLDFLKAQHLVASARSNGRKTFRRGAVRNRSGQSDAITTKRKILPVSKRKVRNGTKSLK